MSRVDPKPLPKPAIDEALDDLVGWTYRDGEGAGGALEKRFSFECFPDAIGFVVRVGFAAQRANHHPELRNVYTTVEIALSTHDAGGRVTERDVALAREIQELAIR